MYHLLLFLALIINTAEMDRSCEPGEVTQPYNITHTFSNNAGNFFWKKNGTPVAVCTDIFCTIAVISERNIYAATISNQITTLKIKTVTTQSGGSYSFSTDSNYTLFSCSLSVYAKPDMVTCQVPVLQTETNEVAVVGTVLGVYPNPICQFSWFIDDMERHIVQKSFVEYKNLSECGETSYCNRSCSFKVPARNFTSGKHQFQVLAYPNVTGQDNDTFYGKNSTQTSPKYVADPIVTLGCLETSVQEGKQFRCTCKETANTFILPTTTLFYGAEQASSALQQVTANFTARRNTLEVSCQSQLPYGTKSNKTQTVQVYLIPGRN